MLVVLLAGCGLDQAFSVPDGSARPGQPCLDCDPEDPRLPRASLDPSEPDTGSPDTGEPDEVDPLPSFWAVNTTSVTRTQWVKVSLPFAPGAVQDVAELGTHEVDGVVGELVPLKWHPGSKTDVRGSLAIAQYRVPVTLAPGEWRLVEPQPTSRSLPAYAPSLPLQAFLADPASVDDAVFTLVADGQTWTLPLVSMSSTVVDESETSTTWRLRGHPSSGGTEHPLSVTVLLTADHEQDHGEMVVVVGNDTLERPVGGLFVDSLSLRTTGALRWGLRHPQAYGVTPPADGATMTWSLLQSIEVGDGQRVPFRGVWMAGNDPADEEQWRADREQRLFPLADWAFWEDAEAAGPVPFLTPRRFSSGELEAARDALDADCSDEPVAGPKDPLGYINQVPSWTGDQADFGSTISNFLLQSLQTGSPCPLEPAGLAVDREALRPSWFYEEDGGVERPVRAEDYPDLFFWSGRPHYDPSWNPQYPEWTTRDRDLDPGEDHGWAGMDDEHYGNNAVRSVYWVTGDPLLKELLVGHQSLLVWLMMTDYLPNASAERAIGRGLKEAILVWEVEDDTGTADLLKDRLEEKLTLLYDGIIEGYIDTYGIAAVDHFQDDGRVPLTKTYPGEPVGVGWQTGFHMEFLSLAMTHGFNRAQAETTARAYLDAADVYFLSTGQPVTYFMFFDPSIHETGGIGESWWSGWGRVAEVLPTHPNAAFVSTVVADRLRGDIEPTSGWWSDTDRWRAFE